MSAGWRRVAIANTSLRPHTLHQIVVALQRWVEEGQAPGRIDLASRDGSVSMPICPHPQKAVLNGASAPTVAATWVCR